MWHSAYSSFLSSQCCRSTESRSRLIATFSASTFAASTSSQKDEKAHRLDTTHSCTSRFETEFNSAKKQKTERCMSSCVTMPRMVNVILIKVSARPMTWTTDTLAVTAVGTLSHFTCEWTCHPLVCFFAATDESPWEHFKIMLWPTIACAAIQSFAFGGDLVVHRLAAALLASFAVMLYTYTVSYRFLRIESLPWDITYFVLSIAVGQWAASYNPVRYEVAAPTCAGFVAALVAFHFWKPPLYLFESKTQPHCI